MYPSGEQFVSTLKLDFIAATNAPCHALTASGTLATKTGTTPETLQASSKTRFELARSRGNTACDLMMRRAPKIQPTPTTAIKSDTPGTTRAA